MIDKTTTTDNHVEQDKTLNQVDAIVSLPQDVENFIYNITLGLQKNRSKTTRYWDWMFQRVYKLYVKYDIEHRKET